MKTIKIYGASDDCIEVEGDVRGCDEFNADEGYIELSTGDVFHINYGIAGVWKVKHHKQGGLKALKGAISIDPHGDGDDPEPYTDTATITGPVEWVRFCTAWPMTQADKKQFVIEWFDRNGVEDLDDNAFGYLYQAVSVSN